ncbi:PREDICTED: glutamate receptor ionotropic, kainate 2-like isoform X2 [Branchiostoma belcheri]|uniref:Glutamate receptor ionotropic, kainate 2-like isoform X2 n=1 Tax=Branchiostoma belcheri TaxID=7741 RepID=A0A6P4Z1F2_BRABE|nr:PREDICTED: glutamate receptor ionotropic, kainate 2-like isoform X2 [Branchiostoma belcheri]
MAVVLLMLASTMAFFRTCASSADTITIGGLLQRNESQREDLAVRYAISNINSIKSLLPNTKLISNTQQVSSSNSFTAATQACNMLSTPVPAILRTSSGPTFSALRSVSSRFNVPGIETSWMAERDVDTFFVSLFPESSLFGKAIVDLVNKNGWMDVALVYEDKKALVRLQELLSAPAKRRRLKVMVYQVEKGDSRNVLREIRNSGTTEIVLDLSTSSLETFLQQAADPNMEMLSKYYHYIVTSLDMEIVRLPPLTEVNITSFTLLDRSRPQVQTILNRWSDWQNSTSLDPLKLPTSVALVYDAVYVIAHALSSLQRKKNIRLDPIMCELENPWPLGKAFTAELKKVSIQGLTGPIGFDKDGRRTTFQLNVINVREQSKAQKLGFWTPDKGLNMTEEKKGAALLPGSLRNRTFTVTTRLEPPFVMFKRDWTSGGDNLFEGYCMDLLDELSKMLGFKYRVSLVPDANYGFENEDGVWDGMVRELMERRADLAVAPFTITSSRERVIDFSKPFMNVGISILYRKPQTEDRLFAFLSPLSYDIWLYVLLAYVGVSGVLFFVARFTPYEWISIDPFESLPAMEENHFTLMNSLWFALGALMQQGSDMWSRAASTKMVMGSWWFFMLIIISSYTANLAAFLTVERMVIPIESAEDLAAQTQIHYGCLQGGTTMTFFKQNSKVPTYQKMWAFMNTVEPSPFTKTVEEGILRVLNGNYAFLLESTMNEYVRRKSCNLTQIGGPLDSKGYGIGTPNGSPFTDDISNAILSLQEQGRLEELYRKWWKGSCPAEEKDWFFSSLKWDQVGGIFIVLMVGLALSTVIAVLEVIVKSKQDAKKFGSTRCHELMKGLRLAVNCKKGEPLSRSGSLRCKPPPDLTPCTHNLGRRASFIVHSNGNVVSKKESVL